MPPNPSSPYSKPFLEYFNLAYQTFDQVHAFLEKLLNVPIHRGPLLKPHALEESPYFLEFMEGNLSYSWKDQTLTQETYQLRTFGDQAYGLSKMVYMLFLTDFCRELLEQGNFSILKIRWKKITALTMHSNPIGQYELQFEVAQSIPLTISPQTMIQEIRTLIHSSSF